MNPIIQTYRAHIYHSGGATASHTAVSIYVFDHYIRSLPSFKNEDSGNQGMKDMLEIPRRQRPDNLKHTALRISVQHDNMTKISKIKSSYPPR